MKTKDMKHMIWEYIDENGLTKPKIPKILFYYSC